MEGARRGTKDCVTGDGAVGSRGRWRMDGRPAWEDSRVHELGAGKERERGEAQ